MPFSIRQVDYFTTSAQDQPGEAFKMLSALADLGINLLAFTAVPTGTLTTQLTLFPEDPHALANAAKKSGMQIQGPHKAILVQGDDRLGAFAGVHEKLFAANVNIYASSGVTDGVGSFGYLLYVRPEEFHRAVHALGL
jgi:hypothetical protein